MNDDTAPPAPPPASEPTPVDLGDEIRRTAERAARKDREEAQRRNAESTLQQTVDRGQAKLARQRRLLTILVAVLVLSIGLNLAGFGLYPRSRPPAWTEESLDRHLREELQFEAESVEFFVQEHGEVPDSLEAMGYPESADVTYERLASDKYRITITDSGKSLTYESGMDPADIFGEKR